MGGLTEAVPVSGGGGDASDSEMMCPTLSWKQRLLGFACCTGFGMFLSLLSFIAVLQGDLVLFAVLFSLGNLASIGGMLFLAGPKTHASRMFDEGRWIATTVYLVSVVLTLIVAVLLRSALLVFLFCLVQFVAMLWYGLSYIPFARDAVKGCFRKVFQ